MPNASYRFIHKQYSNALNLFYGNELMGVININHFFSILSKQNLPLKYAIEIDMLSFALYRGINHGGDIYLRETTSYSASNIWNFDLNELIDALSGVLIMIREYYAVLCWKKEVLKS